MSGDDRKPVHIGDEWKLVAGQVTHPDTNAPAPARVFEVIDEAEHVRRISERATAHMGGSLWTRLGMSDDDTALATSRLAIKARKAVLRDANALGKRFMANSVRLVGTAWPIAQEHAKDRETAAQNAKDRYAGKDVPPDLATVLIFRAIRIAEELRAEKEAGRVAARVFAEACKARPGTYAPEVTRALLLAAIHEEDAWGGTEGKPRGRHYHAIRELAAAWSECTGQEVTVSFDGRDNRELPNPFTEFAQYVLEDQEVTPRMIRRALHG